MECDQLAELQAALNLFEQLQKHRQHISWLDIMSLFGSKLSVSKCVCMCLQQTLMSNLLSLFDYET